MDVKPSRPLCFASFRLDAPDAGLGRGAKPIHLAPKAFAVLSCLADRPGQLVTKEILLVGVARGLTPRASGTALWPPPRVTASGRLER